MQVSAAEYARLRGRSKGWVSEQISRGMPAFGAGRSGAVYRIDPAQAIQWEIDQATEKALGEVGGEQQRLQRAQAEKFELANLKSRGELVLVTYVESVMHGMTADLTARLDAIGGRLANEFPGNDPALVRAKIRAETDSVRSGIAEYFGKLREPQPPVAEPEVEAAPAKGRKSVGRRKPDPAGGKRRARKVSK